MKYRYLILIAAIVIGLGSYLWFSRPQKGRLFTNVPDKITLDEQITLPILIDTHGETVNAAEVFLNHSPDEVEVTAVSKDNSFFTIWVENQPSYSNEIGEIAFAGGLPSPGFAGKGQVGSVTLKPKKAGKIMLTFSPLTRVLRNDGVGTAIPLQPEPIELRVQK